LYSKRCRTGIKNLQLQFLGTARFHGPKIQGPGTEIAATGMGKPWPMSCKVSIGLDGSSEKMLNWASTGIASVGV
jgi:hypothetical protein